MSLQDPMDACPSDELLTEANTEYKRNAGPPSRYMEAEIVPSPKRPIAGSVPCRHVGCTKVCSTIQAECNHAKSCPFGKTKAAVGFGRSEAARNSINNPNQSNSADTVEMMQATPGKLQLTPLLS